MKKVFKKFLSFLCAGCSILRAKGFSRSLDILYGGLGISKLQFLIKKIKKFPPVVYFGLKTLNLDSLEIMDPDPDFMNPDPQHRFS